MIEADRLPTVAEFIWYWTDEYTCMPAIVCKIAKEGENYYRPYLNLCVFRADDAKPWARIEVPPVIEDGMAVYRAHRWCFIGEFEPATI